jgi:uncharacterized protein (DUF58 family)
MLTERGWAAAGAVLALMALWSMFGEVEFLAVAGLLVGGLIAGSFFTRWSRAKVVVSRRLHPALVHEGDRAIVELRITNPLRRTVRNLTVNDAVGGMGTAEFDVSRVSSADEVLATYHIVCRPRGVYAVGPAHARVGDPLGFSAFQRQAGPADRLIVYPEVEDLVGFPRVRGQDPAMQASRPEFSRRGGEDFYTLRSYQQGDDLRRVHWPSSAKRDELMIRQLETPWQARALVMLDVRPNSYEDPACFEKAVRGTASVVRHLARSGFAADLWAGGNGAIDARHYTAAMEALAIVATNKVDFHAVAARMRRTGGGGALVVVTGVPDPAVLAAHQLLSRDYRSTVVMAATGSTSTTGAALVRAGAQLVQVPPTGSWAAAWMQSMGKTWAPASAG